MLCIRKGFYIMIEEKKKVLEKVRSDINKVYGEGSIFYLGSDERSYVKRLSSGSISLDVILGGGYPIGRIIEIFGHESSGKTTLALTAIAHAQRKGGIAAYIDVEQALDIKYASDLGVDINSLVVSQPDSGEDALQIAEVLLRSGAVDILVVDSVSALVPTAELEGDMGDSHVGRQARLMGQALRKLTPLAKKTESTVIFINQLREKVGVMFGNNEVTSGGRSLKFFSSVRLDVRRINVIKQGDKFLGNRVRVRAVKNKVAPPLRQIEFDIMFGEGISRSGDLLDLAVELNIILKAGSWYAYNDMKLGQGRDKVKLYLESNQELMDEIEAKIREYYELQDKESCKEELSKDFSTKKTIKNNSKSISVIKESDRDHELGITKDNITKEINDKTEEVVNSQINDEEVEFESEDEVSIKVSSSIINFNDNDEKDSVKECMYNKDLIMNKSVIDKEDLVELDVHDEEDESNVSQSDLKVSKKLNIDEGDIEFLNEEHTLGDEAMDSEAETVLDNISYIKIIEEESEVLDNDVVGLEDIDEDKERLKEDVSFEIVEEVISEYDVKEDLSTDEIKESSVVDDIQEDENDEILSESIVEDMESGDIKEASTSEENDEKNQTKNFNQLNVFDFIMSGKYH